MKKLTMVALITVFGMSSLTMKADTSLTRWYYTCSDGYKGSFLAPTGTTTAQATQIAGAICSNTGHIK